MSAWQWGASEKYLSAGKVNGSYLPVALISLKDDYVVPADGVGSGTSEAIADAPLSSFLGVFQAATLTGYVPLYTKTVAKLESCSKLFGMTFCDKKDTITWCGVLGGNCQTQMNNAGKQVWVPGLCSFTNSICRSGGEKGEAEMKALVTPENLGVSTVDSPCRPHTGFPNSTNCPMPVAPGLNATGFQVTIDALVDGPHPDSEDLDKARSMINLSTWLVIVLGAAGIISASSLAACVLWRSKTSSGKDPTPQPNILSQGPEHPKKQEVAMV